MHYQWAPARLQCFLGNRFGYGITIEIVTFGFEKCGLYHPRSYKAGFHGCFQEAVTTKLKSRGLHHINLDYIYHLMDMHDPGEDRDSRSHFGENASIMQNMINNPSVSWKFRDALRRVKRRLVELVAQVSNGRLNRNIIGIGLVCKSGRHRSVCFAALLKFCLLAERFVVDTVHLNNDDWNHLCTTCTLCGACTWLKGPIQESVLECWRGL